MSTGSVYEAVRRTIRHGVRAALLCGALAGPGVRSLPAQSADPLAELARRADSLIRGQKSAEAVRLLQEGLRKNPEWKQGLWRLGSLLYEAGGYPAARQMFDKLSTLDPEAGAPWVLLGLCDFGVRDYDTSLKHLQRGLSLGFPPELDLAGPALYHQALVLLATGGFDRAQAILLGLSRNQMIEEGRLLLATGLATLRVPAIPEVATRLLPPERAALFRRAGELHIAFTRRDTPDPTKGWRALVDANPGVPGLHAAFGKILLELPDLDSAETEFLNELKVSPADVTAKLGLAVTLMQKGEEDRAVERVREALATDPQSANGRYLLGLLLSRKDQLDEARRELEASRDLDPFLSHVHFALASVYRRLGRAADAARAQASFKELSEVENAFRTTGRLPASMFERPAAK